MYLIGVSVGEEDPHADKPLAPPKLLERLWILRKTRTNFVLVNKDVHDLVTRGHGCEDLPVDTERDFVEMRLLGCLRD